MLTADSGISRKFHNVFMPDGISANSLVTSGETYGEAFVAKKIPSISRSSLLWNEPLQPSTRIECVISQSSAPIVVMPVATSHAAHEQVVEEALTRIYDLERQALGRLAARKLMFFIEVNFKKRNIFLTALLLKRVDLESLGVHSIIGLARTTMRARDSLETWERLYLKSRKAIEKKGYKADVMFVGMPKLEENASDGKISKY
ncbi:MULTISPECIES: hypothetical protein [Delftia]|uniref:hypothetical protein n=1 Tax=Delftia TaxID=80865 RepID=UPI00259CF083|nr:hypothetical protein [Delftia sp.]